ncbi:MAG: hypothetical protein AABZ84_09580 [Pseudomonadota bacterium]
MTSIITAMVIVVGTVAVILMIYLTIQIYRGEARPEDREGKHTLPRH